MTATAPSRAGVASLLRFVRPRWGSAAFLLAFLATGFAIYAVRLGIEGLSGNLTDTSRLYSDVIAANLSIFSHMIAGGLITLLVPLQMIPIIRRRWPRLHRWSGRVLVVMGLFTALGGLGYIALRGTIGGPHMSVAFAIYGVLTGLAAGQSYRHARAKRFDLHRDWALRFMVLAVGSWIYRLHYFVWATLTDRAAMAYDFSGAFDQVNLWAFYVPYLLMLELMLWRQGRGIFASEKGATG